MTRNPETDGISIEIGGQTYRMIVDTNGLAAFEALFSTPTQHLTYGELLLRVHRGSVLHMRGLIWAALRRHHPSLTVEGVGDLIEQAGGIARFGAMLAGLTDSTEPDPRDAREVGVDKSRPPRRRRKAGTRMTGARSNSPAGASA